MNNMPTQKHGPVKKTATTYSTLLLILYSYYSCIIAYCTTLTVKPRELYKWPVFVFQGMRLVSMYELLYHYHIILRNSHQALENKYFVTLL